MRPADLLLVLAISLGFPTYCAGQGNPNTNGSALADAAAASTIATEPPCSKTTEPRQPVTPVVDIQMGTPGALYGHNWGEITDQVFDSDAGSFKLYFKNNAVPLDPSKDPCEGENSEATPLVVEIRVGHKESGRLIATSFVTGLHTQRFSLLPQQEKYFEVAVRKLIVPPAMHTFRGDALFGVRVYLKAWQHNGPDLYEKDFYVYRYVDAADDDHADGRLKLNNTLVDGEGEVKRKRPVMMAVHESARCTLKFSGGGPWTVEEDGDIRNLVFDPIREGEHLDDLEIVPEGRKGAIKSFEVRCWGEPKHRVFFNRSELISLMSDLAGIHGAGGLATEGGPVSPRLITAEEAALMDSAGKRSALADRIEALFLKRYEDVKAKRGLELVDSASGEVVHFRWGTRSTVTMLGVNPGGPDNQGELHQIVMDWEEYTRGELYFRMARAFNPRRSEEVYVYVDNIMEQSRGGAPYQLTRYPNADGPLNAAQGADFLVQGLVKTAAHEMGHSFSLPHPAQSVNLTSNERQKIVVSGTAGQTFTLSFVDGTPIASALPFDATDVQVEEALLTLATIGAGGAPRAVTSDNKLDTSIAAKDRNPVTVRRWPAGTGPLYVDFGGEFFASDVPTIQATGTATVAVTTLQQGGGSPVPQRIPKLAQFGEGDVIQITEGIPGVPSGTSTNDLMYGGVNDFKGELRFLPGISQEQLWLALKLDWTVADAEKAFLFRYRNASLAAYYGSQHYDTSDPDEYRELFFREAPVQEEGPGMVMLGPDGAPILERLDLGTVDAGVPPQTLGVLVVNPGTVALVIESVRVEGAEGVVQAGGVSAGDEVKPGASAKFALTVHPETLRGPFEAQLILETNLPSGVRVVSLTGSVTTSGPALRLTVPNNNAGGAELETVRTIERFATLENVGGELLEVASIAAASEVEGAFSVIGPALPLRLAPGEVVSIGLEFRPGAGDSDETGLIPGMLRIRSNDERGELAAHPIVGTGLTSGGGGHHWGHDYVVLELPLLEDATPLRAVTDEKGRFVLHIPAEEAYHLIYFDPKSGLVAHDFGASSPADRPTRLLMPVFRASTTPDRDGDFLPDEIEQAIGTSPDARDTDGDGVSDFEAIRAGHDPLGEAAARQDRHGAGAAPEETSAPGEPVDLETILSDFVKELEEELGVPFGAPKSLVMGGTMAFSGEVSSETEPGAVAVAARGAIERRNGALEPGPDIPGLVLVEGSFENGGQRLNVRVIYSNGSCAISLEPAR